MHGQQNVKKQFYTSVSDALPCRVWVFCRLGYLLHLHHGPSGCRGYPQTREHHHQKRNPTVALKSILKISECLRTLDVLELYDIFLTKGDILIRSFIHLYLSVCCKNANEKFCTYWELTVLFLHTKILEIFDSIISSESISQFCPVFEFRHSTKISVF